jgi:hypothetical protein
VSGQREREEAETEEGIGDEREIYLCFEHALCCADAAVTSLALL